MPGDMQTALLRTLQEKSVTRVGGNHAITVNVRIVAATNRDLWHEVSERRFRADLYFRLFGIQIALPMLREREDKFELAHYILKQIAVELGSGPIELSSSAKDVITTYTWPGNVRELTAVLRQAAFLTGDGTIRPEHFPLYMAESVSSPMRICTSSDREQHEESSARLDKLKDQAILNALKEAQGNVSEAARILGVGRNTVYRRLKKMG